jgi:hypothetical protein
VCRHAVYDDVGFSGATIDRPASASAIRSPARNAALGFLSPIRTQKPPVSLSRPHPPAVRYWNMARQRYYRPWARCCRVLRVSADRAARPGPHTREKPRLLDVGRQFPRETGSHLTLRWREMDSNHRFPVRIKHKDGARRRGSAVSSSQPVTGCTGRKRDANSAPPLESIPPLKLLRTSGFDRQRTGVAAAISSGFWVEVRLILENHTIVAANARTRVDRLVRSQADQAASSRVHSASLVQPSRIRYWASSADISMVPSGLTLMCRPEKVCTDPIPEGACRRTRCRSGFSGF